jgi:hypothetical protein
MSVLRTFKQDYAFGITKEQEVLTKINEYFKDDIQQVLNKKSKNDFKGTKYIYELKSRTNKYADYPTTLIAQDKIFSDNHIFLFNFTDGLYYIKYDEEAFKEFEVKDFKRRFRTDIKDIKKPYLYIPIIKLCKIM